MKTLFLSLAFALSSSLVSNTLAQCEDNATDQAIQDLAARYAVALFAGDTNDILAMLDGKLREEKLPVLSRSNYPQQLTKFYEGAHYTISDCGQVAENSHATLNITFPSGDSSAIELWMNSSEQGDLLIYKEVVLY